jgi:uncharacterized UPF0146 family protein
VGEDVEAFSRLEKVVEVALRSVDHVVDESVDIGVVAIVVDAEEMGEASVLKVEVDDEYVVTEPLLEIYLV